MWSAEVLAHFDFPKNVGFFNNEAHVRKALIGSESMGEWLELQLKLDENCQSIVAARFRVIGGVALIASGSVVTQLLQGKSISDAKKIGYQDVVEALKLTSEQSSVAYLVVRAISMALG